MSRHITSVGREGIEPPQPEEADLPTPPLGDQWIRLSHVERRPGKPSTLESSRRGMSRRLCRCHTDRTNSEPPTEAHGTANERRPPDVWQPFARQDLRTQFRALSCCLARPSLRCRPKHSPSLSRRRRPPLEDYG